MANRPRTTPEFNKALKQLNPPQKKAVQTIDGPVMVIAGPGTGKTQVLALRIANILTQTDTPAHAVLALTFTESAAREMRERLVQLMGPDGYYVTVATFHGFCTGVIRAHPDQFLIPEQAEPLSNLERVQFFTQILDQGKFTIIKPAGAPHLYLRALIKSVQDLKREGYTPETFTQFLKDHPPENQRQQSKLLDLTKSFTAYQQLLAQSGRYDFEDMINHVTTAFSNHQNLLRTYQERYHYLLADEYQDTNSAQNQLLLQLASFWGQEANIFTVGDDQQSIYRFQGAALENILDFQTHFPKATIITLDRNYRSQQTILDAAHALIDHNQIKLSQHIKDVTRHLASQVKLQPQPISLASFPSPTVENFFIGQKIKHLIKSGTPASQIAVIYRNNVDANDIADMLGRMDISYNLEGGDDVLATGDVGRLLTLFRTVVNLRDQTEDLDLFTLLNYQFLIIDPLDILKASRFANENRIHLLEALQHPDLASLNSASAVRHPELDSGSSKIPGQARNDDSPWQLQDLPKIKHFITQLIDWGQKDSQLTLVETFELILNQSGLLDWVLAQPDAIRRLNRLNSLFFQVKQLNRADHSMNLVKFLSTIQLMQNHKIIIPEDDLDIDVNAVRLTTAHKAKGQEWDYVFLTKCYDTKWGNRRVPQLIKLPSELVSHLDLAKKEANEDERRLFYVSLTRAKRGAFITWSTEYETKQVVPSMFISEIPEKFKTELDTSKEQLAVKRILKKSLAPSQPSTVSPQESAFLDRVLQNFKLNPTALATYLRCPYQFKLNQMLRLPAAKPAPMAYGSAVHAALDKFFRLYRDQGELPSANFLIQEFESALQKEILTDSEHQLWLDRGFQSLNIYFKHYFDDHQPPVVTERFFGGRFNPVYLGDIPLSGKVDKVELLHPQKKHVRIIDYKTGHPRSRNQIEGKTKYSDGYYKQQLVFYQLLSQLDRTFTFSVTETQLDFVEADQKGKLKKETFVIGKQEVDDLKTLIKEVMKKIRNHDFPRTTDYQNCTNCQFKNHCWPDGISSSQDPLGEQMELISTST
jgi:DNA helicase-2/ATP-dependent DNA helicase PcrA